MYSDLDIVPVERIDALLDGHALLLPRTPNVGLTNALMAAVPAHPFFERTLHELPRYKDAWYHFSKHNAVLSSTGSTFIWAMFLRWPMRYAQPAIMPAHAWGKCSICGPRNERRWRMTDAYGDEGEPAGFTSPLAHVSGSSWHSADSTLILWLWCRGEFVAVGAVCLVVWLLSRARCQACCKQHAAAALLVGCAVCALNRSLEVSLSETLLFRPWIWLIMR